eukprot:366485-Chlamydomonas_euryale.AAC.23
MEQQQQRGTFCQELNLVTSRPDVSKLLSDCLVRVTGSGPTKGMCVLSTAGQRGSSSGLGTVTKEMPLRMVLRHAIPTPPCQPGRENRAQRCQRSPIPPRAVWPADHSTQSYQPFSKQQLLNTDSSGILAMCPSHVRTVLSETAKLRVGQAIDNAALLDHAALGGR